MWLLWSLIGFNQHYIHFSCLSAGDDETESVKSQPFFFLWQEMQKRRSCANSSIKMLWRSKNTFLSIMEKNSPSYSTYGRHAGWKNVEKPSKEKRGLLFWQQWKHVKLRFYASNIMEGHGSLVEVVMKCFDFSVVKIRYDWLLLEGCKRSMKLWDVEYRMCRNKHRTALGFHSKPTPARLTHFAPLFDHDLHETVISMHSHSHYTLLSDGISSWGFPLFHDTGS